MNAHFLEPLDVLFLRGNRLFGDAGSYGESMVPPWPSAVAGAIRSAILARDGIDPAAFGTGEIEHVTLGTPGRPGDFQITDFQLAWRGESGEGRLERLYWLPADLVATRSDAGGIELHRITPHPPGYGIDSSMPTVQLPVLAQQDRTKPASGLWLNEAGMANWLAGELPDVDRHLVAADRLWGLDERVGIGMDRASRRADDGKLFTLQAVVMKPGVGFVASVEGDALDDGVLLRFGGDGRGAVVSRVDAPAPQGDLTAIAEAGRCRLVLTTPGIFPDGWRLPGMAEDAGFELLGVRGHVVCAAVPRAEVISGWDLARWQPKPAQRAAPAGSVYWLEDLKATPEQLRKLADHGLWPASGYDARRRAEGFNCFVFSTY